MKTRNIHIIILILIFNLDVAAKNLITAQKYKYLDETSNSLQELIYEYHNFMSNEDRKFIFDFESKTDGYDEDAGVFNSHFQVNENDYYGGGLGYYRLIVGVQRFAYIARQIGSNSNIVNPVTTDDAIVTRVKYLDNSLDILVGLNLHTEPTYKVENDVKYFTNEDGSTQLEFIYSINYNNINLNMLINEEFTPEQTILSYKFDTEYGEVIPRALYGINSESNYCDYYINYNSTDLFNEDNLYIEASIKGRYIVDRSSEVSRGTNSSYIEIEKAFFRTLKTSIGVSLSNEYTQNNSVGYMYKIGFAKPRNTDNLKLEFYFGGSYNYYPDLQEIQLIDQDIYLLGVKIHI